MAETKQVKSWHQHLIDQIGYHGDDTLTSIATKFGNITRSLKLIIGSRYDASGDIGTDLANILTYLDDVRTNWVWETWQDAFKSGIIDSSKWLVVNPATGVPWTPGGGGGYPRVFLNCQPNANENCGLTSQHLWLPMPVNNLGAGFFSGPYGITTIQNNLIVEWEMLLFAGQANLTNTACFFGLCRTQASTRATNNITGFGLTGAGNVLQTVTDHNGAETVNSGFGETLTNPNKFKIKVSVGKVELSLNETIIATHATNLDDSAAYFRIYLETGAGGNASIGIGQFRIGYQTR